MIKLIAFDLDDTVLLNGKDISQRTMEAFRRAKQQGCLLAVATGRNMRWIPDILLARSSAVDYIISSNGAELTERLSGKKLLQRPMDKDTALSVIQELRQYGCTFHMEFSDAICSEYRMLFQRLRGKPLSGKLIYLCERIRHIGNTSYVFAVSRTVLEKRGDLYKFIVTPLNGSDFPHLCAQVAAKFRVEAVVNADRVIEVTAPGVSKGKALAHLRQLRGIQREETLAIGDSGNDLSMRETAGVLVAMGNACKELKEVADIVAPPVWEDGAAQVIENCLLLL